MKTKTLLRVMALPACILLILPKQRNRDASQDAVSTRYLIRRRLAQWKAGQAEQLWNVVKQRSRRAGPTAQPEKPQRSQNLDCALRLAQDGSYAKAIRALDASGLHEPSSEVQRTLLSKHPQSTPPTDSVYYMANMDGVPPLPANISFAPQEILKAAKEFPRGPAGGGSGFTPTHLLEILQSPGADLDKDILPALAAGLSVLAQGTGPRSIANWVASAPLTALRKPDNGIRPIAVGETVRRLTSSLLLSPNADRTRDLLAPLSDRCCGSGWL